MARTATKQNSFNRGQISQKLWDRQDLELYYSASEEVLNYVVDGRGILEHRPGTRYVDNTKDDDPAWLVGFEYDVGQSYMLAWGQNYVRPYFNYATVTKDGLPSDTPTPYTAQEATELSTVQDNDVLFIVHGNHSPAILQRDALNSFSLTDFNTNDGPYLEENTNQNWFLRVVSGGAPANQGRAQFSTIPSDLAVGSVMQIWDGAILRTVNVLTIDPPNNRAETDWMGDAIVTTTVWSYDGKTPAPGTDVTVEGVAPGTTRATMIATGPGFAPFKATDINRWVRVLYQNFAASPSTPLEQRFTWRYMRIVSVTDSTHAIVAWAGPSLSPTFIWRFGAFYPGNWPTAVWIHGGRLAFGLGDKVYLSRPDAFNQFTPSNFDTTVDPDHAITVTIAGNRVHWLKTLGFQLVVGSPSGIGAVQSSSLGEPLTPGNAVYLPQDSRGAGQVTPTIVADSVIFAHSTRSQLMGTYYRNTGGVDKLGAADLSAVADDMTQAGIRQIAWQDYPHSVNWVCLDDGNLNAITIQPEEKVQAWHKHRLGGHFVEGGRVLHPQVQSIATIHSPDGTHNDLWMVVERTIAGQRRRFVEVMTDYWTKGTDSRDAWFLDAALQYSGNDDPLQTISIVGDDGPNQPWVGTLSDNAAPLPVGPLSLFDGWRWHRGDVVASAGNSFQWIPSAPNAPPGPVDGERWFWNGSAWVQPQPDDADVLKYFQPGTPSYVEPQRTSGINRWAIGRTALAGMSHLAGESISALLDGIAAEDIEVDEDGVARWQAPAAVALLGLYSEARGKLLSLEGGSQNGSSQNKQRPAYDVVFNVWETYGLETGTGGISAYRREFEHYEPFVFPQAFADGEPPALYSGTKRMQRDEQGESDAPRVAWRQRLPLPSFIRSVLVRLNTSDGR